MSGGVLTGFYAVLGLCAAGLVMLGRVVADRSSEGVELANLQRAVWFGMTAALIVMMYWVPSGFVTFFCGLVLLASLLIVGAVEARGDASRQRLAFAHLYLGCCLALHAYMDRREMLDGTAASPALRSVLHTLWQRGALAPLSHAGVGSSGSPAWGRVEAIAVLAEQNVADHLLFLAAAVSFGFCSICFSTLSGSAAPRPGVDRLPFATQASYALGVVWGVAWFAPRPIADGARLAASLLAPFFALEGFLVVWRAVARVRMRWVAAGLVVVVAIFVPALVMALIGLGWLVQVAFLWEFRPLVDATESVSPRPYRTLLTLGVVAAGSVVLLGPGGGEAVRALAVFPGPGPALATQGRGATDLDRLLGTRVSSDRLRMPAAEETPPPSSADEPTRAPSISLLVFGDLVLSGRAGQQMMTDPAFDPLHAIESLLSSGDTRLAHWQTPLVMRDEGAAPVEVAERLKRAGIDGVAVATPSMLARGNEGLAQTLVAFGEADVRVAGLDRPGDSDETRWSTRGWRLALLAAMVDNTEPKLQTDAFVSAEPAPLLAAVRSARSASDAVVVTLAGPRDASGPGAEERRLAGRLIRAGADAVFSRAGAATSGIEWVEGKPVFYGLGTLVGDERSDDPWTARAIAARLVFGDSEPLRVDLCPYLIADGKPRLLAGSSRQLQEGVFLRALTRYSDPFGGIEIGEPGLFSCMPVAPPGY